jgi:hypothetical protein
MNLITADEFIKQYCSMILSPISVPKGISFQLSNNARISFEDDHISAEAEKRLSEHYDKILERNNDVRK